ncbi:MAG: molybdopterin-dependent oxidoreductase [Chloroflexi bacterium]|nr:molybdopterin-dependent oxidoreductase [Chloroflexota bacterium]
MGRIDVAFTVNGQKHHLRAEPHRSLLQVLREDLNLTGTKQACDGGECGSCTILLDGKAAMSCLLPISRVAGKDVVTIEGLGTPQALHHLQEAFLVTGAVQCGFCTPGMIMQAKALLDANHHPSRADIVRRLSRNLCRCTGYVKIIDAILYAAHLMAGGEKRPAAQGTVGTSVERVEGRDKVTGLTHYAADLKMEGMLHARVLWSPHHHARILSLETTEAEKLPGVAAVLTTKDIPGLNSMAIRPNTPGIPLLAQDRVQYVGDAIALVAAETAEVAQQARSLIRVDYYPLPSVFHPQSALEAGAPILGDEHNLESQAQALKGDVALGLSQSQVVVENTYITPAQEHAYLEPEAALAFMDEQNRLIVYACTQLPHNTRRALASLLNVEEDKIRVIATPVGGGFGGKYVELCWMAAALLAYKTRRPVKLVLSREESLLSTKKRPPYIMKYKTGATKDGKLAALEAQLLANCGAYPGRGGIDWVYSVINATGPYEIPHVKVTAQVAGTNAPRSGAFRGLGGIQVAFAYECQMDILARELGLDPLEFRLRNAIEAGHVTITDQVLQESVNFKALLEALKPFYREVRDKKREAKGPWRHGAGIAGMWRQVGGTIGSPTNAYLKLHHDGKVEILSGCTELGQGSWTALAQMVAEDLQLPLNRVVVTSGDSDLTPPSPTFASQVTYIDGRALRDAAQQLRAALVKVASETLEERPENVIFKDGFVFSARNTEQRLPLERLAQLSEGKGIPLSYVGTSTPRIVTAPLTFSRLDPQTMKGAFHDLVFFGAQIVEVAVNVDTGEVKVPRVVSAVDVGRVIHPQNMEGQVEGAIVQGLGYALKEGFIPGVSRNFRSYQIPTIRDAPEVVHIFVQEPVPSGPHGAKGGGETPLVGTAPAVINAIYDATGVRIFELPATRERVLTSLKSGTNI